MRINVDFWNPDCVYTVRNGFRSTSVHAAYSVCKFNAHSAGLKLCLNTQGYENASINGAYKHLHANLVFQILLHPHSYSMKFTV